jgi:hypothetical protein
VDFALGSSCSSLLEAVSSMRHICCFCRIGEVEEEEVKADEVEEEEEKEDEVEEEIEDETEM